jgi:hypothetical protein
VQIVVLPAPGNAQVLRSQPDAGEAVAGQNLLGASVVHEGAYGQGGCMAIKVKNGLVPLGLPYAPWVYRGKYCR